MTILTLVMIIPKIVMVKVIIIIIITTILMLNIKIKYRK